MSTPCLLPQAQTLFFPGTAGPAGPAGPTGPASTVPGPQGESGAIGAYLGTYSSSTVYYDNDVRRDIVDYAGRFWATNNTVKNGLNTWGTPNVEDWDDLGPTFAVVATAINLLYAANIIVGLNIASPGFIKSNNFVAGTSGWLLTAAGALNAYDATVAGIISTDSPRFHLGQLGRTMPVVAVAQFDIAAIADGAITVNPTINNVTDNALIIFGWTQGANSFLENRFGHTTQKFTINLSGTGTNTAGGTDQFIIQIYYRTRTSGGAWSAWTVIGPDAILNTLATVDQSFELTRDLVIALIGDNDIQFSAGFSKSAAGVSVVGAKITVKAFN